MYTTSPYATAADNIYMGTSVHSTNFYPVTENLFHQYRLQGVGGYYADYHHSAAPASAYVTNGFLSYDSYTITSKEEKWQDTGKYYSGYSSGYGSPTSTPQVGRAYFPSFRGLILTDFPFGFLASSFENAKVFSPCHGSSLVFIEWPLSGGWSYSQ